MAFDRLKRQRHLDDTACLEIWTAASSGERPATEHLDECASCRARYSGLAAWLDTLKEEALGEADRAFPAEKLAAQHAHILRRLEAMERPARVIAFPKFARPISTQHTGARRWIAAAAVAGLVIGLAGGQVIDLRHRDTPRSTYPAPVSRLGEAGPSTQATYRQVNLTSDEAVFMEMATEPASYAEMPEPLRALDGLTPHARDYVNSR